MDRRDETRRRGVRIAVRVTAVALGVTAFAGAERVHDEAESAVGEEGTASEGASRTGEEGSADRGATSAIGPTVFTGGLSCGPPPISRGPAAPPCLDEEALLALLEEMPA